MSIYFESGGILVPATQVREELIESANDAGIEEPIAVAEMLVADAIAGDAGSAEIVEELTGCRLAEVAA